MIMSDNYKTTFEPNFDSTDHIELRRGIFNIITNELPNDISIENIKHNQYQECYLFKRGDLSADIILSFKEKGLISSIQDRTRPQQNELSQFLCNTLNKLEGKLIPKTNNTLDIRRLDSISEKFTEFVLKISRELEKNSIKTTLLKIDTFCFILQFSAQNLETCRYRVTFNKEKRITAFIAENRMQTLDLCSFIDSIIESISNDFEKSNENELSYGIESPKTEDINDFEVVTEDSNEIPF